jgi:ABC-2 type transport system ATP-binding protein
MAFFAGGAGKRGKMSLIEIENLSKHFKVLNRREGLRGAFLDLFSGDYRIVKAVDDISF